jgi:anaerobic ribonucleoside-triphosphate reductase activating protein
MRPHLPEKSPPILRIHSRLDGSLANGPGRRAVIWVQGCSLACAGCFNPLTHPAQGGEFLPVEGLVEWLAGLHGIEGLTLSGGEPLQQLAGVTALLRGVRHSTRLSTLLLTGYTWQEIQRFPQQDFLGELDVVIAGRYEQGRRLARGLAGSRNKTFHFLTGRYTPADLASLPEGEIILEVGGQVVVSGIDPYSPGP